jgi:hypothetical protein
VVEELAEHLGPVGDPGAYVFTADKGGALRTSNFRSSYGRRRCEWLAWRCCARMTFATP